MNNIQLFGRLAFCISIAFFSNQIIAQPCENGFAGEYPCELVDQLSFMDLDDFDAENAADLWGWTSPETGHEYAIVGFDNKTVFVNMSTPKYPLYMGYLPTATAPSLWRDVKVVGNYCYIVSEAYFHGLQIFDLTQLDAISEADAPVVFDVTTYYDGFDDCHNIVADEENDYVYAVGSSTFEGGLHIIDVEDPTNPEYAGSSSEGGYVHDAQVLTYNGPDEDYQGQQICIGFNADFLVIYDVTDKTDVEVISVTSYDDVGYVHQGWLTSDSRYMLSNDETDEADYGFTTRRMVWDLIDLDNPVVINYIDYGNSSIDHNLYIRDEMVYESNYTSGLRIFDALEVADGNLEPFGYFDVVPETDAPIYVGNWSNYPYFESGVIPTSNMYGGIHILKPNFFELSSKELMVCNEDEMSLDIFVNKRILGEVNYSVEMEEVPGLIAELGLTETADAPATNQVLWYGLAGLDPGYYPGVVTVSYDLGEVELPFVLIKQGDDPLNGPQLMSPVNLQGTDQEVNFVISDPMPGYGILQVALDEDFDEIVVERELFDQGTAFSFTMPYIYTTYYWRVVKPSACGEDLTSEVGSFIVDFTASVSDATENTQGLSMYPNPATDKIYFADGLAKNETLSVFDISGRTVAQWIAKHAGAQGFDISDFPAGVYVVKTQTGSIAGKFVKQ